MEATKKQMPKKVWFALIYIQPISYNTNAQFICGEKTFCRESWTRVKKLAGDLSRLPHTDSLRIILMIDSNYLEPFNQM